MLEATALDAIPAVAPTLAALHEQTFGRSCGPEYYRWMYGGGRPASLLVIARRGDELIGTIGARRRPMASGLVCGQLMDMIVVPGMRGSGLFADMSSYVMERLGPVDFWFSHANPQGAEALVRKVNFDPVGMVSVLEGQRGSLDLTAGEGTSRDGEDDLADRVCTDGAEGTWRFNDHPRFTYGSLGRSVMGEVRIKRFDDGGARLLDLMTPFRGEELPQLIRSAEAANPDWTRIYFWSAPHLSGCRTALAMGFSERLQARHLVGRPASEAGRRLANFSRWFVSAADTEYM